MFHGAWITVAQLWRKLSVSGFAVLRHLYPCTVLCILFRAINHPVDEWQILERIQYFPISLLSILLSGYLLQMQPLMPIYRLHSKKRKQVLSHILAKTITDVGMVKHITNNQVHLHKNTQLTKQLRIQRWSPLPVWQCTTLASQHSSPSRHFEYTQVIIWQLVTYTRKKAGVSCHNIYTQSFPTGVNLEPKMTDMPSYSGLFKKVNIVSWLWWCRQLSCTIDRQSLCTVHVSSYSLGVHRMK